MAKVKSIAKRHDGISETYRFKIYKDYILIEYKDCDFNHHMYIPFDVWKEFVKFSKLHMKGK
jgi:hypothetical protein